MLRTFLSAACLLLLTVTLGASSARAGDGGTDGTRRPENPTIKADIQALKAAHKKLREDRENHDMAALKADHEALKAARTKLREDIEALRKDHDKPQA